MSIKRAELVTRFISKAAASECEDDCKELTDEEFEELIEENKIEDEQCEEAKCEEKD